VHIRQQAKAAKKEQASIQQQGDLAWKLKKRSLKLAKENVDLEHQIRNGVVAAKRGELALLRIQNNQLEVGTIRKYQARHEVKFSIAGFSSAITLMC
jgi:hypothetical protein